MDDRLKVAYLPRDDMGIASGKSICWVGDSLERLSEFPLDVKKEIGYALRQAQNGAKHKNAKPLHGELSGVLEIVSIDQSGTYRSAYVASFAEAIYVLHSFQKKSKAGIGTPKLDLAMIKKRLKTASELHRQYMSKGVER